MEEAEIDWLIIFND